MKKILLFVLFIAVLPWAGAQELDALRVRGAVFSSPFDESPVYVDSLLLVGQDMYDARYGVPSALPVPEIIVKYAQIMGVDPEKLQHEKIYEFIDQWLGTPYRFGGESKRGIDCSALTRELYTFAASLLLPRSSRQMYDSQLVESFRESDFSNLREGDLLFFRSRGRINHVAVYLCDGKFLSANRTRGVQISDLKNPYWRKRYYAAGRVKDAFSDGERSDEY